MENLLSENNTYTILKKDPTYLCKKILLSLIQDGFRKGLINKKEREYLIPLAPRMSFIYYLPKIHKNPCRPIVSGIDSVMSCIGKFIDFFFYRL